ncbi:hypothetical protein TTHERM_00128500 (macronuclear) [Tetrahymena thermophila SB210]|uniref:Uncharacterized protein n=1 Tax=Tetrahymena thermophila (strain SB210) TaxID=312017 RepID=I7M1C9_TETTS|nr:hypothetical protein TTHERM_00128500 [Tetrahymena thermophila SB210]EAR96086.1 hypothetical protein TTHERM_00128500 [Tetrahymena thermophila SB210]|eukprot:XP_001016331.1 hypothetical protein TTHERM_00128500 [Tetrahymena thermophila SB210]
MKTNQSSSLQISVKRNENFKSAFNQSFSIALLIEIAEKVANQDAWISQQKDEKMTCANYSQKQHVEKEEQQHFSSSKNNSEYLFNNINTSSMPDIEIMEYQEDSEIINTQDNKQSSISNSNEFDLEENVSAIKHSNTMKNILKSFQRYIENEKDCDKQNEFCKLANKKSYSQLVKLLKRNLKISGKRWNMKAKHMIEKDSFKMLLRYFLQNIESIWLENSKVQNKEVHLQVVRFLLQSIDNPSQSQKLKYYQKRRKMLSS